MLNMRKQRRPGVPVQAGPDAITHGPAPECDACGSTSANRGAHEVAADIWAVLCVDADECAKRYRGGTSPASYGAALRGELLGVAP